MSTRNSSVVRHEGKSKSNHYLKLITTNEAEERGTHISISSIHIRNIDLYGNSTGRSPGCKNSSRAHQIYQRGYCTSMHELTIVLIQFKETHLSAVAIKLNQQNPISLVRLKLN